MRVLVFLFSVLVFAGCTSSTNISKRDPFYNYVGKTIELRRPVSVIGSVSFWAGGHGVMSLHPAKYGLIEKGTEWQGRGEYGQYGSVLFELPVGHQIQIDSVWDEIAADEEQIIAYGHTTIPPSTNEVSFAYPWGEFWTLWRAPWEPDNTPAKRAPAGKLPPHFDYDMFKSPTNTPTWGAKVKE